MGTDHLLFAELSDLYVLTVADLATSHFDTPETRKGNRGGAAQTHRQIPLRKRVVVEAPRGGQPNGRVYRSKHFAQGQISSKQLNCFPANLVNDVQEVRFTNNKIEPLPIVGERNR